MMSFLTVPFAMLGLLVIGLSWLLILRLPNDPDSCGGANYLITPDWSSRTISLSLSCALLGLFLSLYGFDRSLWLDEFGTLWTIQGSASEVILRTLSFQGQSPLYYLITWCWIQLFGVSEIALRLPSLLFGIVTTGIVYLLGKKISNHRLGVIAASLIWLSPGLVRANADARPYALALFMTALMFYGFISSAQSGESRGRWLFIIGGAGLFATHFILALVALGIGLAYLAIQELQRHYSLGRFSRDVAFQLLLVCWSVAQLHQIWARREELSWLGDTNYLSFFELSGPFVIAGLIAIIARSNRQANPSRQVVFWTFVIAFTTQIVCLTVVGYLGVNLHERRYVISGLVPATLVGAMTYAWLPRRMLVLPLSYWVLFISTSFLLNFRAYGTFSAAGFQNWQQATRCIEKLSRNESNILLLYRSGFVEEDYLQGSHLPQALFLSPVAPLKASIRRLQPIQLTYTWTRLVQQNLLPNAVEPALREASIFYFLSCGNCFNQATGNYPSLLLNWLERSFPAKFIAEPIYAGTGITLIRFVESKLAARSDAPSQFPYSTTVATSPSDRIRPRYSCDA